MGGKISTLVLITAASSSATLCKLRMIKKHTRTFSYMKTYIYIYSIYNPTAWIYIVFNVKLCNVKGF